MIMQRKTSGFLVNRKLMMEGEDGARAEIDLSTLRATDEQKEVVAKLLDTGDLEALSRDERNSIKDLKARFELGTPPDLALIVRFDCTWVRIDEQMSSL